jgi:hypothetical protein
MTFAPADRARLLVSVQALLQGAVQFTTIPDSAARRMN